ncbi:MAG: hypothetical protein ACM3RX_09295 [Methanococcaceae archaeon]
MDPIKQYITQCVIAAANNLRLSTEKIEVVALIREFICGSSDLENDLHEMKKITELSTFAIRLNELYNFFAKSKIDFLKLTDKFKEHSHYLVRDLNNLLEKTAPQHFRQLIDKLRANSIKVNLPSKVAEETQEENVLLSNPVPMMSGKEQAIQQNKDKNEENEELKAEFIFQTEEKPEELLFENYEERILNPIKELDAFLKNLAHNEINTEQIDRFYILMKDNAELSSRIGFDIISNMHLIFAKALYLIKHDNIKPSKQVIEGMRSSLIVIVAVVRGKEVDITNYLNKAEEFGRTVLNFN